MIEPPLSDRQTKSLKIIDEVTKEVTSFFMQLNIVTSLYNVFVYI